MDAVGEAGSLEGRGGPAPNTIRDRVELAAALTGRRRELGLSVRTVAQRMQMPASTVGGYFSGRHLPTSTRPEVIEALLDAMEIAPVARSRWRDAVVLARHSEDTTRRSSVGLATARIRD